MDSAERVYFPGLNALRVYAALSVVIAHTSDNFGEMRAQPAHYALLDAIVLDSQSAVNLFFVLSGFLITYLLLHEQSRTGTIAVSRFYIRRILRIWPLYYLIVFLGLVVLPILLGPTYALSHFPIHKTAFILLLMPNFVGALGPLTHLWSIGLEEQFYIAWPWVLRSADRLVRVSLGIVIVKIAIAPVIAAFQVDSIKILFLGLRFECMAIGALGAYLYFRRHWSLRWIYSPLVQGCGLAAVVFLAVINIPVTLLGNLITSVVFTVLILNVTTNTRSWIRLENRMLNALGRISYGVYMYHYPLLYAVIFTLNAVGIQEGDLYALILYGTTVGGTLLLAAISYRWFELPFLRLKSRFAIIQTKQ
jgi:peptidoglycan/LPS O-acetylase OafA/YrhL